ncbi:hypothetical protein KXD93_05970 [Mucilaginibacter sp. BJC16-A38]|uniref:hypothetical protein n=1 Tax=Mucilaginibacter phenanthrenivorans TaxID=1234842 RepID=UPI002157D871|nr:hypothetical protein [Mucilaginibacter phenanthrenivorans]MCR8557178.1 hypothetical protein [Mucilaginibacter phenanthrenivorans]
MKKNGTIIGLLILICFKINAQGCVGTNNQEREVLKLVNSLPEVVKENKYRKRAHSPIFLRAYIQNTPTKTDRHYYVTISEEKEGRLFTYDWYKVDIRKHLISYYDVINDKTMSLKEWRAQRDHQSKK